MIFIKRLHHVQICIPPDSEDAARRFYANVLGLTEIQKPDALKPNGGLWFRAGDIELHFGVENAGKSKRHPAFEVADLEAVRRHLEANGVAVKNETPVPGMSRFTFLDPFENRIEFLELFAI